MEEILLPIFNIVVQVYYEGTTPCGGSISSSMHELGEDEFNNAMDGIESMILAHAIAGLDIRNPRYLEGIEVAVQSCANNI